MARRKAKLKPMAPLADLEFSDDSWPPFRCSHCGNPTIQKLGKTITHESAGSAQAHDHEAWEPEWISGVFVATAHCLNSSCKEKFALSGEYSVEADQYIAPDGNWDWHYTTNLKPKSFTPPIRLIELPNSTPDSVSAAICDASNLYFSDISGTANRLRQAVECYLDDQKIARKKRSKSGKLSSLTLHQRIELLHTKDSIAADHLMAVKWIGNVGSHSNDVSREYLDIGLRVVEKVLKLKFDNTDSELARSVKEIIERKGKPVKKSKKQPF